MWMQYLVRLSFVAGIGITGIVIMFSSALLGKPVIEKVAFALIGLFVTAIAFLFLMLNKDALSIFDGAY